MNNITKKNQNNIGGNMNINIRKSIINNFQNNTKKEIKDSIDEAIKKNDEITLPGLGVFFELLWNNTNENEKETIIEKLQKTL